jgi:type II restriction/modification system DNA methylase subunit YeeA
VGNPPFLGGSKKRGELGEPYFNALNATFKDVPGFADLVCYWFHKAGKQVLSGEAKAAGLVATNSIRSGANRKVLDAIVNSTRIFEAWSDEPWINDGAAVRVSLVAFGCRGEACLAPTDAAVRAPLVAFGEGSGCRLDGREVAAIHADLTAGEGVDLTQARRLGENSGASFMGVSKTGPFDIPGELARKWLKLPNPNGRPNSEVVRPWSNGMDLTSRSSDTWIIDFGTVMPEAEAARYEAPFQYALEHVKPKRMQNNREIYRKYWWHHAEARPGMRVALKDLPRYIATSRVAKHRMFVWQDVAILPDSTVVAIARDDDTTLGILSSRFHVLWSLGVCSSLEDRPRYTSTTCFETFPFPPGLSPRDRGHDEAIAAAARELNELRENWLNPPEWVEWQITSEEEKAGFPPRPVARPGHEAELKKRTLTNLYNACPAWLLSAHAALDTAVAAAYGWTDYRAETADEEILRRLLALNRA